MIEKMFKVEILKEYCAHLKNLVNLMCIIKFNFFNNIIDTNYRMYK